MQIYQVETTVTKEGTVIVQDLPLHVGEKVKVTIQRHSQPPPSKRYPLRGKPYRYDDPFKPIADEDWEVLK